MMRVARRRSAGAVRWVVAILAVVGFAAAWAQDQKASGTEEATMTDMGNGEALRLQVKALRQKGHFAEALRSARELLDIRRANPESLDEHVEDVEHMVATLERIVDMPGAAQEALANAYRMGIEVDGHFTEGEYAKAAELAAQAHEIFQQYGIDEHPFAISFYRFAEAFGEPDKLYGAVEVYRRVYGESDERVYRTLMVLGSILYEYRDYERLAAVQRETVDAARKVYGERDVQVAENLNMLAIALEGLERYAEAEATYLEVLDIYEEVYGEQHPEVAGTLYNLGILFHTQGDYEKSKAYYLKALEHEEMRGEDDADLAKILMNLMLLEQTRGNYETAAPWGQRALAIRRSALAADDPVLGSTIFDVASNLGNQGKYAEAEPLFLEALEIYRQSLGPSHPYTINALEALAAVYRGLGDDGKAERYAREVENARSVSE